MVCEAVGAPLVGRRRSWPTAKKPTDVVIEVYACGVCRTDLHVVDGDLPRRAPEIVPGHEVVGRVAEVGPGIEIGRAHV